MARAPGSIRDAILAYLNDIGGEASLPDIRQAVVGKIGNVSPSSVRSYLNLNVPGTFERTGRGRYRLKKKLKTNGHKLNGHHAAFSSILVSPKAQIVEADCFEWLAQCEPSSIHAAVTDPPYGLVEYTEKEQSKLRNGNKGGIWRIPPSYDGHKRAPLPRFTVLDEEDRKELHRFFRRFATLLTRAVVPGANVVVASNPLLSHIVASAMTEGGLELRGYITRLTMTMRGGDRPKNAHKEFDDVSVMPRSMFEPWVILRRPLEGRAQDNLRKWKTGGFRRLSADRPFGDVIESSPTPKAERQIAAHPSLKPQAFMRQLVRAALPLGQGVVLDPFMGGGSTVAAAVTLGYASIGLEKDPAYFQMARRAIPGLATLSVNRAGYTLGLSGNAGAAAKRPENGSYQESRRAY